MAICVECVEATVDAIAALGPDDPWIARARGAYQPRGAVWWHRSALARRLRAR